MGTRIQILSIIATQLLLLGYTLYGEWNPFQLFFVYVTDLFIASIIGMVLCVARGGIKFVPWALFSTLIVCGLALGLLFAGMNVLIFDFNKEQPISAYSFMSLLLLAASMSWLGILINSSATVTRLIQKRHHDSFFLPLYPLVRILPLFPVLVIGGFITILGFPQAIIIGMTIAHAGTDIILVGLKSLASRLQQLNGQHALVTKL